MARAHFPGRVDAQGFQDSEVLHVDRTYEKGITLSNKDWKRYQGRLLRSATLPKWDVTIKPQLPQ